MAELCDGGWPAWRDIARLCVCGNWHLLMVLQAALSWPLIDHLYKKCADEGVAMPAGQSPGLHNMRGEDEGAGVWEAESGARPAFGRRHHHSPPREDAGGAQRLQAAAQKAELKK